MFRTEFRVRNRERKSYADSQIRKIPSDARRVLQLISCSTDNLFSRPADISNLRRKDSDCFRKMINLDAKHSAICSFSQQNPPAVLKLQMQRTGCPGVEPPTERDWDDYNDGSTGRLELNACSSNDQS
jgi:hypothetical protein